MVSETVEICGGVLRDMYGTLVAPDSDLDGQYDENVNCFWTIEAKKGYIIRYMINYILIEGSKNGGCTNDYLLVRYF